MRYNLQFFGEGENEQTVAESDVTVNAETGAEANGGEPAEHHDEQTAEVNAQFAAARRKAEADYQKQLESDKALMNQRFQRAFPDVRNPKTGELIKTWDEYLDSVEEFKNEERAKQLQSAGIDPRIIEQMVNNSPAVIEANRIMEEQKKDSAMKRLEADLKELSQIEPSIKSLDDVEKHESYVTVVKYVQQGLNLVDAFKLANFSKLTAKSSEAAKQAAINAAKSQSHLTTTNGVAVDDDTLQIPESEYDKWKSFFPTKSKKELTAIYNKTMKARNK